MHAGVGADVAKTRGEATIAAAAGLFDAPVDVRPGEALLGLVRWTAGEVEWWRRQVNELGAGELTWGMTKEVAGSNEGGGFGSTTLEAKPHIAYVLLVDASNRLERYASSALKAGVEERLVRVAESQGQALGGVIQRVLDGIYGALLVSLEGFPGARDAVVAGWPVVVSEVVPRELNALVQVGDSDGSAA